MTSPMDDLRQASADVSGVELEPGWRMTAAVPTKDEAVALYSEVMAVHNCQTLGDMAEHFARAALSRWGRPAAAPVPDFGEVAAALKVIDKMQQEWVLLGNDDDGTASPSLSMPISLRRFTVLRDALFRAATLLQQQATPVPVSERLPGPKDCDAEGRCWWGEPQIGDSHDATWSLCSQDDAEEFLTWRTKCGWLPANALPLPAPEGGEAQP